jgi:hypothetical protein
MVTITWNLWGFHLVVSLPKGVTSNGEYYLDNILAALIPLPSEVSGRKLILYADNLRAKSLHQMQNHR